MTIKDKLTPLTPEKSQLPAIVAFFSIDLTGSTEYKVKFPDKWAEKIKIFYGFVDREVGYKYLPKGTKWKLLGDEVIFCLTFSAKSDLFDLVKKCQEALESIHIQIDRLSKTKLGAKGVLWIAECSDQKDARNLKFVGSNEHLIDYIGPEIDIGFRLGKFSYKGKLVVSSEIATLMGIAPKMSHEQKQAKEITKHLQIISYEKLKGVWGGRAYPVIWYIKNPQNATEGLPYDAHLKSNLITRIKDDKMQSIEDIIDVYHATNQTKTIDNLINIYNKLPTKADPEELIISNNHVEVHCALICFNDKDEILLLKRSEEKNYMPGRWEFGCAQLMLGQSFNEAIKLAYHCDLKLKVEVDVENPVATYHINKVGNSMPGVIFTGNTSNPAEINLLKSKHIDSKWIPFSDVQALNDDEYVPNAKVNILKAITLHKNSISKINIT